MFLELIFRDNFYRIIFRIPYSDEKGSEISPPASPNGFNIEDAAVNSVHRCTLLT